jgi:hypothetical protein
MKTKTILTGAFLTFLFAGSAQLSMHNDLSMHDPILELLNDINEETTPEANQTPTSPVYLTEADQSLQVVSLLNEFKGIISIDVADENADQAITMQISNWPTGVLFNLTDELGNSVNCDEINNNAEFVLQTKSLQIGTYHLNIFDLQTMRSTILKINKIN